MEYLIGCIVLVVGLAAVYGWFSKKSTRFREDEYNRTLRLKIEEQQREFQRFQENSKKELEEKRRELQSLEREKKREIEEKKEEIEKRTKYLADMRSAFSSGYVSGRKWLAHFIAEADRALDESIVSYLRYKKPPAKKASEEVANARAERRVLKERVKLLEYQLKSFKEYFPQLEEYEEIILDEAVPLISGADNLEELEASDPVLRYVPKVEYEGLGIVKRNQLALNRYLLSRLSQAAIGRSYERQLGYLYERESWKVEYHGIIKGHEDLGRDLICSRDNEVRIIQAKCWAAEKVIHEKHIFQLYGTTQLYLMDISDTHLRLLSPKVTPIFVTTTTLSKVARKVADWLKIEVQENFALDKTYPMIKCNIGLRTNQKIYHLPFDQQYDRTKISTERGEFYAQTVAEAEGKGFRRAYRFTGLFE